ncbi:MAG: apurinic endonuclease [Gaeavirus sp.]|uniref:Apurinic endonuclease n=1 Tax=Gaeavirus sp. TaxID=2487767 RepID=A0A3G4ZZB1_9VIRU|nr:MAG: apurinic endonuclease [Gaeavirus sp.]
MKLNLGINISLPTETHDVDNNATDTNIDFEGLNSLQIMFTKNKITSDDIKSMKNIIKNTNYKYIFIHASYQINICTDLVLSNSDLFNPSLDIFVSEIDSAIKLNADGIVVHMGKNVKNIYTPDEIENNMTTFVVTLFSKIKILLKKSKKFVILFETPAGQGTETCSNIRDIVNFIQKFKTTEFYHRIGLCIDTCHIFQAGHDINDSQVIKNIHKILEPIKDKIKLIHLNDSYHPFNQHIDRHEQLGQGYINIDKLIKFIMPYIHVPLILETKPPYKQQIQILDKIK